MDSESATALYAGFLIGVLSGWIWLTMFVMCRGIPDSTVAKAAAEAGCNIQRVEAHWEIVK